MVFNRRSFIKSALGGIAIPTFYPLSSSFAQSLDEEWKTYQIKTEINIEGKEHSIQGWLPLTLTQNTDYFRTLAINYSGNTDKIAIIQTPHNDLRMISANWDKNSGVGHFEVITTVATRDRKNTFEKFNPEIKLAKAESNYWTRGTQMLPTDGIVRQKVKEILSTIPASSNDLEKAKAIYNWVVDNTRREASTRGCGVGDVKYMLETNNMGGKCADINAIFVALARTAKIPSRDVYGIRIDNSARGYKSLGKSDDITKAQHCRAEFFANGYGWIAVDPADVRKVILEEPGNLTINDPKVTSIRDYLFGNWEMNWMAYNYGHDVNLRGSSLGAVGNIPFLMYPQAESNSGRFDSLDPANFKYQITSKRLS